MSGGRGRGRRILLVAACVLGGLAVAVVMVLAVLVAGSAGQGPGG